MDRGVLVDATEDGFDVETEEKKKVEGEKKKQIIKTVTHYALSDVKMVKDILDF